MGARRVSPKDHGDERAELRRQIEETQPKDISIAIMPLGPEDLAMISKATGYSITTIKTLAKVYRAGGLKSAGSAAFQEMFKIGGAGWRSVEDKAAKVKSMLTEFHKVVAKKFPEAAREHWPVAEAPRAAEVLSKLHAPGKVVTETTRVPAMSPDELKAQNRRVARYAQERIDELSKNAAKPEPKSAMVRARKPSPRAEAKRVDDAWVKRDAAIDELKRVRELGVRGDLPGKNDALARAPIEYGQQPAETVHRPPQFTEGEVERLAEDQRFADLHHPDVAGRPVRRGKVGGGPNTGGDATGGTIQDGNTASNGQQLADATGLHQEAGVRQLANSQMGRQEATIARVEKHKELVEKARLLAERAKPKQ